MTVCVVSNIEVPKHTVFHEDLFAISWTVCVSMVHLWYLWYIYVIYGTLYTLLEHQGWIQDFFL